MIEREFNKYVNNYNFENLKIFIFNQDFLFPQKYYFLKNKRRKKKRSF